MTDVVGVAHASLQSHRFLHFGHGSAAATAPQRTRIGAAHGFGGAGTFGSDAPFHAPEVTGKIPSRSPGRFPPDPREDSMSTMTPPRSAPADHDDFDCTSAGFRTFPDTLNPRDLAKKCTLPSAFVPSDFSYHTIDTELDQDRRLRSNHCLTHHAYDHGDGCHDTLCRFRSRRDTEPQSLRGYSFRSGIRSTPVCSARSIPVRHPRHPQPVRNAGCDVTDVVGVPHPSLQ